MAFFRSLKSRIFSHGASARTTHAATPPHSNTHAQMRPPPYTHPSNQSPSQPTSHQPTQTASHPPTHLQADANSRCKQTFSCPRALLNTNKHWSFLVRCFFRLISVTSEVQVRGGWVWEWECRVSWQWYGVFITGPPALSAFPSRHNKASGIDRPPRLRKSF